MTQRRADPLGSCGSSGSMYSSDEEEDGGGISFTTTETKCELLFEQGLELKICGDMERALTCFLDCLKGMQKCQYFAKLPQTLHHLGELYSTSGNTEIALEFAQAEKLFYEAVLVSSENTAKDKSTKTKRKLFAKRRTTKTKNSGSNPAEYGNLLIKKAVEYEMLARMCAKEKKFDLAVDYSGKAANLKRSVYGNDHPDSISAMETFTLMYAEMGRSDYATALKQVEKDSLLHEADHVASGQQETTYTPERQPQLVALQEFPPQEEDNRTPLNECKQTSHTDSNEQGNGNESTLLCPDQYKGLVQLLQPCTLIEDTSKLSNDIHWSAADNVIHTGTERLEICIHKPELNIEHNRFCPLWVLLLGGLLEMCLLTYVAGMVCLS